MTKVYVVLTLHTGWEPGDEEAEILLVTTDRKKAEALCAEHDLDPEWSLHEAELEVQDDAT